MHLMRRWNVSSEHWINELRLVFCWHIFISIGVDNKLHELPDGSIPIIDGLDELCELSVGLLLSLHGCNLVE